MSDEVKIDTETRFEVSYLERGEGTAGMRAAVERHRGRVIQEKPLEKVRLAYPIEKQTYAFLGCMEFVMDPAAIGELQQAEFRLNKELLRALVHRAAGEAARPPAPGTQQLSRPPRPKAEPLLTNEALEKKIEEILQ